MVMAAGRGTRMRPLTDDRCKALVTLAGKPLIDWTLDALAAAGVARAIVNVHHFADGLEAHLQTRPAPAIEISDERNGLLETGGGLVKAAPALGGEPVFVANIDAVWADGPVPELVRLAAGFDPQIMDFLLMLAPLERTLGFDGPGDFFLGEDGRLTRRGAAARAPFAYAGVMVMHPRVLEGWPQEPFSTNRLWDRGLAQGRVFGQVMNAFWMHVGDPNARDAAENRLRSDP
ncbi:nucleotidyltransferase family protein [Alkalicaulis satelles]|uniref:Nucleotidyltransferase family protein n=2 Tax=Alkalicaulis satelles TaxID=2609175 RepID=A0A5M6ZPF3_9PROT|nr:nucleotidyltransferase family protein [Alkalicaulis satelles]